MIFFSKFNCFFGIYNFRLVLKGLNQTKIISCGPQNRMIKSKLSFFWKTLNDVYLPIHEKLGKVDVKIKIYLL